MLLLKQFIASRTSFAMLVGNSGIGFKHSRNSYIDPFLCDPKAIASIRMLLSGREKLAQFNVVRTNLTKLDITYEATPPFRRRPTLSVNNTSPSQQNQALRFAQLLNLIQALTQQHLVFRSGQQEHVGTLFMYTRGVSYSMAQGFFQSFMHQYLTKTVGIVFSSLQVSTITAIHGYSTEFPSNLYYEEQTLTKTWPDQLYIKAVVLGLD